MLKKLSFLGISIMVLVFTSCKTENKKTASNEVADVNDNTYELTIEIEGLDKNAKYNWDFYELSPASGERRIDLNTWENKPYRDSLAEKIVFKNGSYTVNGEINHPRLIILKDFEKSKSFPFMLGKGKQNIKVNFNDFNDELAYYGYVPFTYKGQTKENDIFKSLANHPEFVTYKNAVNKARNAYEKSVKEALGYSMEEVFEMTKSSDPALVKKGSEIFKSLSKNEAYKKARALDDALRPKLDELKSEAYISFVQANPDSYLAFEQVLANVFMFNSKGASYETMAPYMDILGSDIRKTEKYAVMAEKYNIEKGLVKGEPAVDFDLPTPDGKTLKLSSLKGKVVIIDFWASWCVWCRKETPNLKKQYAKYKDKGLEIVSVSFDKKEKAYRKALEHDDMPWLQAWDIAGVDDSEVTKAYGVKAIPFIAIIDREGNIYASNVRGPKYTGGFEDKDINKHLEKIFGF
ncbi:TlpA family protein disulfide reductase [Maribacter sp. 2304DJ31-5]|uniref:TlpA family protein disulfide reductase n=1 Tax=Maribacter sp. 2304DJ31-5 TaxID=3386273 RepID=UPI0039BC4E4D